MGRLTITRRFEFDAAHRVMNHESKCANLHGHRYAALVQVAAPDGETLDQLGRVIDFSAVKAVIGSWIDEYLDHNIILCSEDPILSIIHGGISALEQETKKDPKRRERLKRPFLMRDNPTAENLSKVLYTVGNSLLARYVPDMNLEVTQVTLYETPNCFAVYSKTGE